MRLFGMSLVRYGRVVAGWIEAEGRKAGAFLTEALSLGAVVQVV